MISTMLFLSFTVSGQDETHLKPKDKNWEVGMDLLWLIEKGSIPPGSLFLRKNYIGKNGIGRALRLRLGIDANKINSTPDASPGDTDTRRIGPYLSIGTEWQKSMGERSIFFYGVDLGIQYSHLKTELQYSQNPSPLREIVENTWQTDAISLIGFKYKVTDWLAFSVESTFNISYSRKNQKSISLTADSTTPEKSTSFRNTFGTNLNPITVVNFHYIFP